MFFSRLALALRARSNLVSRIFLATVQILAIGWFSPGPGLPLDDAWIHQVVARTFAETGTLGYAPGQHGAAATSYLWAALLAIGFKIHLFEPSRWALILNGLATLATGQLLFTILKRTRPRDGLTQVAPGAWSALTFASALFASTSPNILWFACSGMEAMPFVALSLAAIWAATDETKRSRALFAGLSAGALVLLRPDAAPFGGLLAVHAFARKRTERLAPIALPWLACIAIYVGSNLAKTGHAMPSTLSGRRWLWFEMTSGLSRVDLAIDFLDAWATRLSSFTFDTSPAALWVFVGLAAYGAFSLARGAMASWSLGELRASTLAEDAPRLLLIWALFHAAFYALLLPTPGHGGRYQPLTPLLFTSCLPIGTAFLLREIASIANGIGLVTRIRFGWFVALGLAPWVAMVVPVAGALRDANALAVAHIQTTEIGTGHFLNTLPEGAIASFDIGGTGFAAKRRIFDLGGLSDPKTAALMESGRIATWLEANHVRWIVLPEAHETILPTFENYRTRLHIEDNPSLTITPVHEIETPFYKWDPAIRATWNAAPKQVVYEVTYTGHEGPREVGGVAPDARSPIADPARLIPTRERIVAEHMLATLAAWGLPVDVTITSALPARRNVDLAAVPLDPCAIRLGPWGSPVCLPKGAISASDPCAIKLGPWGIAIDGCASVGDPQILRANAYELVGRYLDVGDLAGALKMLPHVIAKTHRRIDPSFHPPLASVMAPDPMGVSLSPMSSGRWGLAVFALVLVTAVAIEKIAARLRPSKHARVESVERVSSPIAATFFLVTLVALTALATLVAGCGPNNDVTRAISRGRGGVEIAIENGGSVDYGAGRAPILEAAWVGDVDILALLLDKGARTDVRDEVDATPLHLAARGRHSAALVVLISAMSAKSSNASCVDCIDLAAGPRRRTALHEAVLATSLESVTMLLRAGANANAIDTFGQTPLHVAASIDPARSVAIAEALLANVANPAGPADPSMPDARGFTALHAAASTGNVPLVTMLASRRSLLEITTPAGETALDVALRYGRDRSAEALLAAGALMKHGVWPPLHQAARMDAVTRAAVLVASGADLSRRVDGKTALDVAAESGSKRVEALLRERAQ
ncbi:MAG: ankyrin repeat domain-containing protein [Polyangiaceae bacterium]|nr:ankyrin repeat domain-containing protein [Polyangiaceae bacterium]